MTTEDSSFFSRWSRRKAQATVPANTPTPTAPPHTPPRAPSVDAGLGAAADVVPSPASPLSPAPPASRGAGEVPPSPTLDDVSRLTTESDFKPFVGRTVAPEVKNAAMKKLFADPHFNVMDGLDIYIDDYSQPNPLPAEMLKKMASAQFMKLVEPEPEPEPKPETTADAGEARDDGPPPTDVLARIPTAAPPDAPTAMASVPLPDPLTDPLTATAHDHLDLQLQPDHAPRRSGPGSGAG